MSPALTKSGWLGVAPGTCALEPGETEAGNRWTGDVKAGGEVGLGSQGRINGVRDETSSMPSESALLDGESMIGVPGGDNSGKWGLWGVSPPALREGEGSGITKLGSSFSGEESSMVSIAVVAGPPVTPSWGVAIESDGGAPCGDRFFFSSSPRGCGGR